MLLDTGGNPFLCDRLGYESTIENGENIMKSHLAGKIIVFIQILLSAALLFLLKTSGLVPDTYFLILLIILIVMAAFNMLQIASLNGHLCHIWRPACDLNGGQPRTH